jgi:hypothetical protein
MILLKWKTNKKRKMNKTNFKMSSKERTLSSSIPMMISLSDR